MFNALTQKDILNRIFWGKFKLDEKSGEFSLESLSGKIIDKTLNEEENTATISFVLIVLYYRPFLIYMT